MNNNSFIFKFLGYEDSWHIVRCPTWSNRNRTPWDVYEFNNKILDWLFKNCDKSYHLGSCNFPGYPKIPALANNNSVCVLLESADDFVKFCKDFTVRDTENFSKL